MSSSNISTSGSSTFNPYTQSITILMADGVTPVTVLLSDIDASNFYNTACTINYSAQMGACFIMFFVLVILTKDSKRRTTIFVLNALSLLFGFLRALLLAIYFVSPWVDMYPTYTFDFTQVPGSAYTTSIVGTVIPLLMTITVDLSLVLQAYTVCKSMSNNIYQYAVTGLSCVVFLLAVGFRFAEAVTNSMAVTDTSTYYAQAWIQTGALATETTSIWFFSIIFTGKLLWTLRIRRAMGWKQWSGVRILAAMGGCTMIIPSIFATLEYVTVNSFPEAGTLAITMVALLLPLSALWASMAIDQETSTLNLSHLSGSHPLRRGSNLGTDLRALCGSQMSQSTTPSSRIEFLADRKGSLAPISPMTIDSRIEHVTSARDSTELDLEAMGVRINKSYGISSVKSRGAAGSA